MTNNQAELLQLHEELRHRARQLSLLNDLAREMTGSLSTQAIYDRVTEMCTPVCCSGVNFRREKAQEKMERLKKLMND